MIKKDILKLDDEIISEKKLKMIKESECVKNVEFNGTSFWNGYRWYSVFFGEKFAKNCKSINEIQVYV